MYKVASRFQLRGHREENSTVRLRAEQQAHIDRLISRAKALLAEENVREALPMIQEITRLVTELHGPIR
jgi:hypothetical protein